MKRIAIITASLLCFLAGLPQFGLVAYAGGGTLCPSSGDFTGLPGCGGKAITSATVGSYVSTAVTLLLVFAVILALFFLIWGGVRWIMSGGDKAKVTAARDTIIAAIVGLVLALLAYAILNLVMVIVTGHGLGNFSIPTFTTG
jgi:hypothetical protein